MQIFITGVAGFLGSHLADRMIRLGHTIVGIDNLAGGSIENVSSAVAFYQEDCINIDRITALMKGSDIVYHTACSAYDGLSVFSPMYVTNHTFQNSISVISAAIQNNVKRFIFCSSMARYGSLDHLPFTEESKCEPENPYGIAKLAVEKVLESLAKVHNMEYVILVPHNIIGPRQCYQDPYRNVASIMINRILQGHRPIIYGDGQQKRCFSFIDDVMHCFEHALTSPHVNGEIINVGPDEELISITDLCFTICKLMQVDCNPIYVDARPLEVKFATCSANKARQLLGYTTRTSLQQGLTKMIEAIKVQGAKPFKYNRPLEIVSHLTPKTWIECLI